MVNTSTLSNHDKYKYFTVYFLIPAYSFNPKAAFEPFWKTGLEKTARGQRPNPHPRVHPPQSFYFYYTIEYQ